VCHAILAEAHRCLRTPTGIHTLAAQRGDSVEAKQHEAHAHCSTQTGCNRKQHRPVTDNGEQVERHRVGKSGNTEQNEDGENTVAFDESLAGIEEDPRPSVTNEKLLEPLRPLCAIAHQEHDVRAHRLSKNGDQEDPAERNKSIPQNRDLARSRQDHGRADFIQEDEDEPGQNLHTEK